MNSYLNNYIHSLSTNQSANIASILQGAILNTSENNTVLNQLNTATGFKPLVLTEATTQQFIASSDFTQNVSMVDGEMQKIFLYSNDIALLLASLNSTLISQAQALESQISNLEERLAHYAFLVANNNSYPYSYLEDFMNNYNRDSFSWQLSDRTNKSFSVNEQALAINSSLTLSTNIISSIPLTPSIVTGNALSLSVSNTGIQNSVTSVGSTGWRMELASSQPITSTLPGFDKAGAQIVIEFMLNQPAFVSQIEIVPFSDTPIELVQVQIFSSDDNSIFNNINPITTTISSPITIQIPYQSVSRFRLYINQPAYTRSKTYINTPVRQSNDLINQPSYKSPLLGGDPSPRKWNYSEFFNFYFQADPSYTRSGISKPKTLKTNAGLTLNQMLINLKTKLGPYISWNTNTPQEGLVSQLFLQQPGYYKKIFQSGMSSYNFLNSRQEQINPMVNDPSAVAAMPTPIISGARDSFSYIYDLGLQYVAMGFSSIGNRGVFVSTPMLTSGSIGEVRLNVSEEQALSTDDQLDSILLTSTEYSVSNVSNPNQEKDWHPIFPINAANQTMVTGERFFPNASGSGFLRFSADRTQTIKLYRNHFEIAITPNDYIYDTSNNLILGITISKGSFASSDIFTIDYITSSDFSVVTFNTLDKLPVVSISDTQGSGEGFVSTFDRNTITLSNTPYIDYAEVSTASYSAEYGMTPYQPITVILANGTNAINLTNYSLGQQTDLSSFTSGYYYIQSGNKIMFNQSINTNFRVFYKYLASNVRVRVIERSNSSTFATPTVSSFNLKAKLIKSNSVDSLGLS